MNLLNFPINEGASSQDVIKVILIRQSIFVLGILGWFVYFSKFF